MSDDMTCADGNPKCNDHLCHPVCRWKPNPADNFKLIAEVQAWLDSDDDTLQETGQAIWHTCRLLDALIRAEARIKQLEGK